MGTLNIEGRMAAKKIVELTRLYSGCHTFFHNFSCDRLTDLGLSFVRDHIINSSDRSQLEALRNDTQTTEIFLDIIFFVQGY